MKKPCKTPDCDTLRPCQTFFASMQIKEVCRKFFFFFAGNYLHNNARSPISVLQKKPPKRRHFDAPGLSIQFTLDWVGEREKK